MAGRPKQFSNAAEKQRAYRDRKKSDLHVNELAMALLNDAETEKVTLLKTVEYHIGKGKRVSIEQMKQLGGGYWDAHLLVDGQFNRVIPVLLMNHLIRSNAVEQTGENWSGVQYKLIG